MCLCRHLLALAFMREVIAHFLDELDLVTEYVDLATDVEELFDSRCVFGKHERSAKRDHLAATLDATDAPVDAELAVERRNDAAAGEVQID